MATRTEQIAAVPVRQLFPRASVCVQCEDTAPACPSCPTGESCQVTVPLTCTECPKSYCAANSTPTPAATSSSGHTNTGAIAGGVVGGIAIIAAVTYLVWRFCIKTKRQRVPTEQPFEDTEIQKPYDIDSFQARRDQRSSTHTVGSIASTVLTRASNIIQIAYIPGVMNRATPTSPTVLVPPVPPIPIAVSSASQSGASVGEQHFFVPGDLRDSTYSGFSGFSDRTSYARTSYAPRSSIASTIYGKNAVIAAPPQTGMRIKPTMVNLKSTGGLSPSSAASPPVPSINYEKYNQHQLRPVSSANSTFSVGSTFLNNASAHTAMTAKPVVVRVGSNRKKPSNLGTSKVLSADTASETTAVENPSEKTSTSSSPNDKSKSPISAAARDSATTATIIEESPAADQGPFSDPPARSSRRNTSGSLSAVIEEATRRASGRDVPNAASSDRNRSPFGDEHETQDA